MRKLAMAGLAVALSATMTCGVALADAPVAADDFQATASSAFRGYMTLVPDEESYYSSWRVVGDQSRIVQTSAGDTLLASDGTALSEKYGAINSVTSGSTDYPYPYLSATNDGGVGTLALIDIDGNQLSDFVYGDFYAVSDKWVIAIVVEPTDDESAPYSDWNGNYYNIGAVDIYYQGAKIGSLPAEDYGGTFTSEAFNDYLVLQTTTPGVSKCIDPQMNVNEVLGYDATTTGYRSHGEEYYMNADGVMVHISGVPVFTPECTLDPESVVCPYGLRGDGLAVLDLTGAEVVQLPFSATEFTGFVDGYGVIEGVGTDGNWYSGVVNENFELVVPLEFDMVGDWDDPYTAVVNGYTRVVKNGQIGYYKADGTVAVPVQYAESAASVSKGLFSLLQDIDGTYRMLSVEKGMLDAVYSECVSYEGGYASPLVIVRDAQSGLWGVVDYRGDVVVPFEYTESWHLSMPEDGSFVLAENDETEETRVYYYGDVTQEAPAAEVEQPADEVAADSEAEQPAEPAEEPAVEAEPAQETELAAEAEPTEEAEPAQEAPAAPVQSSASGSVISKLFGR